MKKLAQKDTKALAEKNKQKIRIIEPLFSCSQDMTITFTDFVLVSVITMLVKKTPVMFVRGNLHQTRKEKDELKKRNKQITNK